MLGYFENPDLSYQLELTIAAIVKLKVGVEFWAFLLGRSINFASTNCNYTGRLGIE